MTLLKLFVLSRLVLSDVDTAIQSKEEITAGKDRDHFPAQIVNEVLNYSDQRCMTLTGLGR